MSDSGGKVAAAFGLGGIGAVLGAIAGAGIGLLIAVFTAGLGAVHWFQAQPPDWWIVTGFCAIMFFLVVAVVAAGVAAVIGGLVGGGASVFLSGMWLATRK